MSENTSWRKTSLRLTLCLVALLLAAAPGLAQSGLSASAVSSSSIKASWSKVEGWDEYPLRLTSLSGQSGKSVYVRGTGYRFRGLAPNTWYTITLTHPLGEESITVATKPKTKKPNGPALPDPIPMTCLSLPARVAVFGHSYGTQCQMVDAAGVGQMDVIKRGFIDAVDVWHYVNGGLEVCFRNQGALVFLDAAYSPRMAMDLESYPRAGMTCGRIDSAGTVVLVADGAAAQPTDAQPADAGVSEPAAAALPTFDAIPLSGCVIKLIETLFLRATPGGEITGLVWLHSEVPAYEINGYWYKIEFEGKSGYVSRFYRKVLRGGCG